MAPLVQHLSAADPATQEEALVPALRDQSPILPPGTQVTPEPSTWEVTGTDEGGQAVAGTIRAQVTEPGQQPSEVLLSLANIGGQWLLYQTAST